MTEAYGGGQCRRCCCNTVVNRDRNDERAHVMTTEGTVEPPPGQPDDELVAPEEVRRVRTLPRPITPSQEEVDRHCIDHLPYRDWCPYCVEAFGRERAHHSHTGEERDMPLISLDYMYLAKSGVCARDELPEGEQEGAIRVLVAKCAQTKCMFAHVVPQEGNRSGWLCRPRAQGRHFLVRTQSCSLEER